MTEQAMVITHEPTMNLRFIEREVCIAQAPLSGTPTYRKVRILQQMFVNWSTGLDEYWQDVPFVDGDFSNQCSPKKGDDHG